MYRVRIVGTGWSGGPSLNTLYFTSDSSSAADALAVAGHVRAQWYETISYLVPNSVTQNVQGDIDVVDPATGDITDTFSTTPTAGMVGRGGANSAPIVAAGVLRLSTALFLAGRRLRGRAFLSPLASDKVDTDGTMTTAARGYGDAFGPALMSALTSGQAWVVWHRPKAGTGGVASAVVTATLNDKIGELRSRRD